MYQAVFYKSKRSFYSAKKRKDLVSFTFYPLLLVVYKDGVVIKNNTTIKKIIDVDNTITTYTSGISSYNLELKKIYIDENYPIWQNIKIYQDLINKNLNIRTYDNGDELLGEVKIISGALDYINNQGTLIYEGDDSFVDKMSYFEFDVDFNNKVPTGFSLIKINDEIEALNYFKQNRITIKKYYREFSLMNVVIPVGQNVYNFENNIKNLPFVDSFELDTLFELKTNYQIPYEHPYHWNLQDIKSREAWELMDNLSLNSIEPVEIAIIDSLVDIYHPELVGKISNSSFAAVSTISDLVSPNDYALDPYVVSNCSYGSSLYLTRLFHGTGVSGTAAASNSNNDLMLSVSNDKVRVQFLSLMNVSYDPSSLPYGCDETLVFSSISALIECFWRIFENPKCVTISTSCVLTLDEIAQDVLNIVTTQGRNGKGIPFFASAGNSGTYGVDNPGKYNNVYSVGAWGVGGTKTGFSQWGPDLFIMAPGERVLSLSARGQNRNLGLPVYLPRVHGKIPANLRDLIYTNDNLLVTDGTSTSSPMAASVAATLLYANPYLTKTQVIDILSETARKIGFDVVNNPDGSVSYPPYVYDETGKNDKSGFGVIDHEAAMSMAIQMIPEPWSFGDEQLTIQITNAPEECFFGESIEIETYTTIQSPAFNLINNSLGFINIKVYFGEENNIGGNELIGDFWYDSTQVSELSENFDFTAMTNSHSIYIPCQPTENPDPQQLSRNLFATVTAFDGSYNEITNGFSWDNTGILCDFPCGNQFNPILQVGITWLGIVTMNNGIPTNIGLGGHAYRVKLKNLGNIPINRISLKLYETESVSGTTTDYPWEVPLSDYESISPPPSNLFFSSQTGDYTDTITPPLLPGQERIFLWFINLPAEVIIASLPLELNMRVNSICTPGVEFDPSYGELDPYCDTLNLEGPISTLYINYWPS